MLDLRGLGHRVQLSEQKRPPSGGPQELQVFCWPPFGGDSIFTGGMAVYIDTCIYIYTHDIATRMNASQDKRHCLNLQRWESIAAIFCQGDPAQVATESEAFLIDTVAINKKDVKTFLAAQLMG